MTTKAIQEPGIELVLSDNRRLSAIYQTPTIPTSENEIPLLIILWDFSLLVQDAHSAPKVRWLRKKRNKSR